MPNLVGRGLLKNPFLHNTLLTSRIAQKHPFTLKDCKNTYINKLAVEISRKFCQNFPIFRPFLKIIADFQRFAEYEAEPRHRL